MTGTWSSPATPLQIRCGTITWPTAPSSARRSAACARGRATGWPARQLTALTLRHLQAGAVTVVLVGGLPGTGKSALAGALAGRLGWSVLSSDRIRKELAGLPAALPPARAAHAGYGSGIYAPSWTERTYAELVRRAAELTSHGESVILDATWVAAEHRAAAAAMADRMSADLVQLQCTAPAALAAERIQRRADSLSDAYPEVAARMARTQAPWPDAVAIDTGSGQPGERDPAGALRQALDALDRPEARA